MYYRVVIEERETPIGAMTEEEKQEYRLDQQDEAEKLIVNPFDTMEWGDGQDKPLETIDLTPVGCQTPEGNEQVNRAMRVCDMTTVTVAELATQMVETLEANQSFASAKFDALKAAIKARKDAYENLLKSVSGR
jgi:hypothetical protein